LCFGVSQTFTKWQTIEQITVFYNLNGKLLSYDTKSLLIAFS